MSDIKKDQIWKSLIGESSMFIVEKIYDNGWVNGSRVRVDNGKYMPVERTAFAVHQDTMKHIMQKVQ